MIEYPALICFSGVPGSGKSTMAKMLANKLSEQTVTTSYGEQRPMYVALYSADDYVALYGDDGKTFHPEFLADAHGDCIRNAVLQLSGEAAPNDVVIVDNTNTYNWERAPYMATALAFSKRALLVHLGVLESNLQDCAERNRHGVPLPVIQRMYESWEEPPRHWPLCSYMAHFGYAAKDAFNADVNQLVAMVMNKQF